MDSNEKKKLMQASVSRSPMNEPCISRYVINEPLPEMPESVKKIVQSQCQSTARHYNRIIRDSFREAKNCNPEWFRPKKTADVNRTIEKIKKGYNPIDHQTPLSRILWKYNVLELKTELLEIVRGRIIPQLEKFPQAERALLEFVLYVVRANLYWQEGKKLYVCEPNVWDGFSLGDSNYQKLQGFRTNFVNGSQLSRIITAVLVNLHSSPESRWYSDALSWNFACTEVVYDEINAALPPLPTAFDQIGVLNQDFFEPIHEVSNE